MSKADLKIINHPDKDIVIDKTTITLPYGSVTIESKGTVMSNAKAVCMLEAAKLQVLLEMQ